MAVVPCGGLAPDSAEDTQISAYSIFKAAIAIAICAGIAACAPPQESADDFGYEQLRRQAGDSIPDGSGVAVHLVEGQASIMKEIDGVETKVATGFALNMGDGEFTGKDIVVSPGLFRHFSGHATAMGRKFFGKVSSTSPGISDVHAYASMAWFDEVLNLGRNRLPATQSARIANHSWVGNVEHPELPGTGNVRVLRRLDWLVATDEFIQVAGFNGNPGSPLLSAAWNAISTSHIDGAYVSGSASVGHADYPVDRVRPHIVVREKNPSSAAARVSSAVALLIEAGHAGPDGSEDPAGYSTTNRNGDLIYNAGRSEVLKAALMAGAKRTIFEGVPPPETSAYRQDVADRTDNGLDRRYGAGRLDIYNSYSVIVGRETNSAEDEPAANGALPDSGFDYDESFGGARSSNAQATYFFSGTGDTTLLTATLVWNAAITPGTNLLFDRPAGIFDLDLYLYDVSDPDHWEIVSRSTSRIENTETIRAELNRDVDYALRVEVAPGQRPFEWDYGLAWRLAPNP